MLDVQVRKGEVGGGNQCGYSDLKPHRGPRVVAVVRDRMTRFDLQTRIRAHLAITYFPGLRMCWQAN
jgi:hypothetical protein